MALVSAPEMDRFNLFATPIRTFVLGDTESLDRELSTRLGAEAKRSLGISRSNAGGWHSVPDLCMRPDACYRDLMAKITRHVDIALHDIAGGQPKGLDPGYGFSIEAWAMVMSPGDYITVHDHAAAHLSAVYYVDPGDASDAHELSGQLCFLDPRPAFAPLPGLDFSRQFLIKPTAGMLVIFPGWLSHFVHPYRGRRPRVSISCNIRIENLPRAVTIGPGEHDVLRVLFDNTPAAEVTTLCRWVALRFNLRVGVSTDENGAPWDKRGLRRCWDVLEMLPAAHVENNADLSSLTRYRSSDIEGWASPDGEAAIGYGKHDIDNTKESGNFTDASDPLRGTNMFDATVRHEIGHRVDEQVGGPAYCATDAGGAWKTWDTADGMAARMVGESNGPISNWKDEDEKKQIIDCLQSIIDDRKPEKALDRLRALPFCAEHETNREHLLKLNKIAFDAAVAALQESFSHQDPWEKGGVPLGTEQRVYQEAYDWPLWVSYKHEARDRKMSQYQFRSPGEWFAEAYAAYYQPPGKKGALMDGRDDATKQWFDDHVDPQHGAGATVTKKRDGGS